ncbi:hypothetical protein [Actinomadura rudentiformis]|nr:hypothetical protein [Actinomadura rudentiformis]
MPLIFQKPHLVGELLQQLEALLKKHENYRLYPPAGQPLFTAW